jgi:hypothetical protein
LPTGIATDGLGIWTAHVSGSISIVDPDLPSFTTFSAGFNSPRGILFDGANVWVTDAGDATLKKLDSGGSLLQSVPVGTNPGFPAFDGANIWVPNTNSSSITVVRVRDGAVLATLMGNGLSFPESAAFDGQRILVANDGNSLSLWKAADLTPIGNFLTGANTHPLGACSDGVNFWITLAAANQLARF